jgi:hypothetical protein
MAREIHHPADDEWHRVLINSTRDGYQIRVLRRKPNVEIDAGAVNVAGHPFAVSDNGTAELSGGGDMSLIVATERDDRPKVGGTLAVIGFEGEDGRTILTHD